MKTMWIGLLMILTTPASAEWKVERGERMFGWANTTPPAMIAKVQAKAASLGISAYLQIECFEHPQLSGLYFGVVTSKDTKPGFMARRYQYDDGAPVQTRPFPRTSLTKTGLGDVRSNEFKGLIRAKRLRLTLLPKDSAELPFDFDVSGASAAMNAIPCKENRPN